MIAHDIDPELLPAASALPRVDRADVAAARRVFAERILSSGRYDSTDDGVTVEERACIAPDGHRVGLRVYRPHHLLCRGVVYHVHGGGFILGDLEMSHVRNVEIARETGAVVVAVDYRLAPEWPFPTPVEDVYGGLEWLLDHVAELGVDPSRIVLHGVSAGGALAAAVTLLARDRSGPPIHFQHLVSPPLDDRLTSDSARRFTDTPAFTRRDAEICWAAYLGGLERGSDAVPALAAPARVDDLAGLPPAYVSVAALDPLRDDGLQYARSLLAAGVTVELHLFPGTFHGSAAVAGAAISIRERAEEIAVLARALADSVPSPDLQGDRPHA